MRALVQKWGNSLALRIPKSLASEFGFESGSPVDLSIEGGRLVVAPASSWEVRLEELVGRITEANRHAEVSFGPPVGNEFW